MRCIGLFGLLLVLFAFVTESWCAHFTPSLSNSRNKPSRLPCQSTRQECLAFQITTVCEWGSSWSLAWILKCNCFRNGCSSIMHPCMPVFFTTCKYHALDGRKLIIVLPFTVDEILKDRRVTKHFSPIMVLEYLLHAATIIVQLLVLQNCKPLSLMLAVMFVHLRTPSWWPILYLVPAGSPCLIFVPILSTVAITTAAAYTSLFTTFMFKEYSNELTCSAQ